MLLLALNSFEIIFIAGVFPLEIRIEFLPTGGVFLEQAESMNFMKLIC